MERSASAVVRVDTDGSALATPVAESRARDAARATPLSSAKVTGRHFALVNGWRPALSLGGPREGLA
jgi:hypothetical protein